MLWLLFSIVLFVFSVFSYSLVDHNLVLMTNSFYQAFQVWLWQTFFVDGVLMAWIYFFFIFALFIFYLHFLEKLKKEKKVVRHLIKEKYFLIFFLVISPLFFSYNFLSHDVFNYIFNARMVVVYGANPHTTTALAFSNDLWTRFMHNTHTVAPYGYGWTYLSLLPYSMGFGKFTLTLLAFRVWSILSLVLLYFSLQHLSQSLSKRYLSFYQLALVFLNPLLLIEVIMNYHNDLWMMSLAVFAVSFLVRLVTRKNRVIVGLSKVIGVTMAQTSVVNVFLSLVFLVLSVLVKLVTVVLIPLWFLVVGFGFATLSRAGDSFFTLRSLSFNKVKKIISKFFLLKVLQVIPDLASMLLFLPLFTHRSQQFLPWYVLWVLVWIPLTQLKKWRQLVIVFTVSSLLRYLPEFSSNFHYTATLLRQQKLITWLIPVVYFFFTLPFFHQKDFKNEVVELEVLDALEEGEK